MQHPDHGQQPPPPPPPAFGSPPQPYAPPPQPYGSTPQPYGPPPQPYAHPPQAYAPPPHPYAPHPAPVPPPVPPHQGTEGPEFLAVDRHNSVVVDASGIAFEDHGRSIEFTWPEIHAVHYHPHHTGKALVVHVAHVDGRHYECVVDAKRQDRLHQLFSELAAVLGHYRPMG